MKEDREGGAEDVAKGGAEDVAEGGAEDVADGGAQAVVVVAAEGTIRRNFFSFNWYYIYIFIIYY